jgi:ribosomal-protein-alanine N-acetyltransferase
VNGRRVPAGFYIAPMALGDIPQVVEIDRLSFPTPWSASSYHYELTTNKAAHFIVLVEREPRTRPGLPRSSPWRVSRRLRGLLARLPTWLRETLNWEPARRITGFAGFWLVEDEAHIGTLALHPAWRGRGLGEQLLAALLRRAADLGARLVTLEVRAGNHVAQRLYRKYGFEEVGRRKAYYRDNHEDALLMTAQMDDACRQRLREKHPALISEHRL